MLLFDRPRHREHLRLPVDYPRLNELPEWFTVETAKSYRVRIEHGARRVKGEELLRGLSAEICRGQTVVVTVE